MASATPYEIDCPDCGNRVREKNLARLRCPGCAQPRCTDCSRAAHRDPDRMGCCPPCVQQRHRSDGKPYQFDEDGTIELVLPPPPEPINPPGWRTGWRRKQKRSLRIIKRGKLPPQ